MEGQYSLFDSVKTGRPCEYRFVRYIGQKVVFWRHPETEYRIVGINPYYTEVEDADGNILVGTPTTICPMDVLE